MNTINRVKRNAIALVAGVFWTGVAVIVAELGIELWGIMNGQPEFAVVLGWLRDCLVK